MAVAGVDGCERGEPPALPAAAGAPLAPGLRPRLHAASDGGAGGAG